MIAHEIEDKLEPVCLPTFAEGLLSVLVIPWVLWKFTTFLACISCLHRALKPIEAMGWHGLKSLCAVYTILWLCGTYKIPRNMLQLLKACCKQCIFQSSLFIFFVSLFLFY
jgi:hypothetical protein